MNKFFFILFNSLFIFSTLAIAQVPQPRATPPVEEAEDVVKISTALIQIDVVITDKDGNQIKDLKPEDFEIYENGKKQNITNFSYIASKPLVKSSANSANAEKNLTVPTPTKKLNPDQVRRTYALVIDDLGLSFGSVFIVKKSLEKFINEQMRDGDLVAIVRTGGGIGAVQSFTSDKKQLLASIEKLKWNVNNRSGLDIFDPITTSLKEDLNGQKDSGGAVKNIVGTKQEKAAQAAATENRRDNLGIGTIGSLNYIVRGMRDLPGRKSVMLFSEGFVLFAKDSPNSNFRTSTKVFEALKSLADTANRSSVVIYTLDPRGLQVPGMANANDQIREVIPLDYAPGKTVDPTADREKDFNETQQSLRFIAEETGGIAFLNQNNLNKGLKEVVDDQSYYLVGYEPDSETFDPKKNRFNKFEVKVNRPGAKLRYRTGFFANSTKEEITIAQTPTEKIKQALLSPFDSNEINLRLYTISGNDPKNGDFIRSLINISAKDLLFSQEADGKRKASFDIVAMTFGIDGKPIDQVLKNYTIQVDEKTYQRILERGFVYDLPVRLEKAGAYQFRIALRDAETGKVGSASQFIEVPNLKEKKLWVSNVMLEGFSIDEIKKGVSKEQENINRAYTDTTLREFASPVVLRYGAVIYNAVGKSPQLSIQTRLFSDDKIVAESKKQPVSINNQTDLKRIDLLGAFTLGNDLPIGDYVFQIIITDELAREKKQIATQTVDFAIVE